MAGRSQMIAGPGYPDLERSQTDARSMRIRRAFQLSQRGLITGCGLPFEPDSRLPALVPVCVLSTPAARRSKQGTTLKMRTGVIVAPDPGIRFTREEEARLP